MKFDINAKTISAIKESTGAFFITQFICNTWSGITKNLWSGVSKPNHEKLDTYDEYEYQGIKVYIDKNVKISETLQISSETKNTFCKTILFSQRCVLKVMDY